MSNRAKQFWLSDGSIFIKPIYQYVNHGWIIHNNNPNRIRIFKFSFGETPSKLPSALSPSSEHRCGSVTYFPPNNVQNSINFVAKIYSALRGSPGQGRKSRLLCHQSYWWIAECCVFKITSNRKIHRGPIFWHLIASFPLNCFQLGFD